MTFARMRLGLAVLLLVLWLGWLLFLVLTTRQEHPVILSRPQFLVSGLDVLALRKLRATTILSTVGQMMLIHRRSPRGRQSCCAGCERRRAGPV